MDNVIGQSHDSEKDDIYLKNVAKLGSSSENIYIVNDVLPQEEYTKIVNFTENSDLNLWISEPWGTQILNNESISKEIKEILNNIFQIAKTKSTNYYNIEFSSGLNDTSKFNLIKWGKGCSMKPHIDTYHQKGNHIVVMYYINDNYDGGEIVFPDYNVKIKPKSNSLIMFPGNENYLHEVLEVTGGLRYTFPTQLQFAGSTFFGRVRY
jgi:hypothetical protein